MSESKSKLPGHGARPLSLSCLEIRDAPSIFLRLESYRERVAFPYAALLRLELSNDENDLVLFFITHEVHVRGKNLQRIYEALSQGQAVAISVLSDCAFGGSAALLSGPLVSELRIKPLAQSDLRRR